MEKIKNKTKQNKRKTNKQTPTPRLSLLNKDKIVDFFVGDMIGVRGLTGSGFHFILEATVIASSGLSKMSLIKR